MNRLDGFPLQMRHFFLVTRVTWPDTVEISKIFITWRSLNRTLTQTDNFKRYIQYFFFTIVILETFFKYRREKLKDDYVLRIVYRRLQLVYLKKKVP